MSIHTYSQIYIYISKNQPWLGLCLSCPNDFLVVLCVPPQPELKKTISDWLMNEIPDWNDMLIVNRDTYLGVFLGIEGCCKTHELCEEKCLSRCFDLSQIAASGLPTIVRYDERVVPSVAILAQAILAQAVVKLIACHGPWSLALLIAVCLR